MKQTLIDTRLIDLYGNWWNGKNHEPLLSIFVTNPQFDVHTYYPPWMKGEAGYWPISHALPFCEKEKSMQPLHDAFQVLDAWQQHYYQRYLGAAFPSEKCYLGTLPIAGIVSGYVKNDTASGNIWFEHAEGWSLERIAALPEDATSPLGELFSRAMQEFVRYYGGRLLMADHTQTGILDILAALRTTNQLVMDCIDSPELVLAASAALERIFWRVWEEMRSQLDAHNGGLYSSWVGVLSERPYVVSQSDFSVLLSPSLFEELALPAIRREAQRCGRAIYHLDGPEEIKYLDQLLAIPEIRAIQWPPYPGYPALCGEWDEMFRKVIDSGRRLVLGGGNIPADPDAVRTFFSKFPKESFHLTFTVSDVRAGENLLCAGESA